jgi:O-antigen/teichoic acid export membrane protein
MMLSGSLLLISGWVNTIILGIYATDSDVGIYSVVLKISTFSTFILMSINAVSAPRFAQFHAAGNIEGLGRYTAQTAKVIFFSSVPVFAGIILFREWLLGLFGDEFVTGATALLITMVGQCFNVFAGSVGHFLNMTGHQRTFSNIVGISTIINVALCFLLIPTYGLLGSAVAGMVFMASWNLAAMIYINRKFGIRTFYFPFG